jgi:putative membrane protein
MDEARADIAAQSRADEWRRLSAWSVLHFAARTIARSIQALVVAAPATYGAAQSPFAPFAWTIPAAIAVGVIIQAVLSYTYYFYRVRSDTVEVRRGFLFKKHLNLSFARIQDINLEHPFYYRPLGLVTLKLDSAGSAGEEVHLAALGRADAEALRAYIVHKKRQLGGDERVLEAGPEASQPPAKEACFARSVEDLVVHGLTNNRAYLAIAGIMGLVWQTNLPVGEMVAALGIDFDVLMGSTIARLTLFFVIAFVSIGIVTAVLSVLVSVVVYYGFTVYRTGNGLAIERGLLTKHETHVQKSRIQAVVIRQDWLEFLIGRCNVIFEQISHRPRPGNDWQSVRQRILVPAVRADEIATLTGEVFDWRRLGELSFTPIAKSYFYKHAAIFSAVYLVALAVSFVAPVPLVATAPLVVALWALHVSLIYMHWQRAGLAIDGDIVAARHGTIGINYSVFPAFKIQNVVHVQSLLMRRRNLSNVLFRTAASIARVPYLSTGFAKALVNYCAYSAESSDRSWM